MRGVIGVRGIAALGLLALLLLAAVYFFRGAQPDTSPSPASASAETGEKDVTVGKKVITFAAPAGHCYLNLLGPAAREAAEPFVKALPARAILAITAPCAAGAPATSIIVSTEKTAFDADMPGNPGDYDATVKKFCDSIQSGARKAGNIIVTPYVGLADHDLPLLEGKAEHLPATAMTEVAALGFSSMEAACYSAYMSVLPDGQGRKAIVAFEGLLIVHGKPLYIRTNEAYAGKEALREQLRRTTALVEKVRGLNNDKPPETFQDCDICPEMVVVPAGKFLMGSVPAQNKDTGKADIALEAGQSAHEFPQHEVVFARPFAVSRFEITLALWDACEADKACKQYFWPLGPRNRGSNIWNDGELPMASDDRQRPAVQVTWNQVQDEFLPWLQKKTGKPYRLPTEAEWEYAARAGTTGPYSGASMKFNSGGKMGLMQGPNNRNLPWPVGGVNKLNAFGLADMHGNVWELVEDCYHKTYSGAPADGSAWASNCETAPDGKSVRVRRGGSYRNFYDTGAHRSANRDAVHPDFEDETTGLRVALTLPAG